MESAQSRARSHPRSSGSSNAYWRAANYLSVGQIYLLDNPLLREPLVPEHVKPRLLGHFGTTPGPEPHLRAPEPRDPRARPERDLRRPGPATAARALVANAYLEGTYSEVYPAGRARTRTGCASCSASSPSPAGSRATSRPRRPGSIHEGGELGYALAHAYGAAFDNPDLLVACVVGDGEAETGPLAASWHSNKFLNPRTDGAVLPILHLNGYKIANPTVLARIPEHGAGVAARGLRLSRRSSSPAASTASPRRPSISGSRPRSTRRSTRSRRIQTLPARRAPSRSGRAGR